MTKWIVEFDSELYGPFDQVVGGDGARTFALALSSLAALAPGRGRPLVRRAVVPSIATLTSLVVEAVHGKEDEWRESPSS